MTPEYHAKRAQLELDWIELRTTMDTAVDKGNWLAFGLMEHQVSALGARGMLMNLHEALAPAAHEESRWPKDRPVATVHVIEQEQGRPECQFTAEPPSRWPQLHVWIRRLEYPETSASCRDPNHELHCLVRYVICEGCRRVVEGDLYDAHGKERSP